MTNISNTDFAEQARSQRYDNIPYNKLDCQAFVETVLKDCGVRKADGTPYNWTGSNKIWRTALYWRGTIEECLHTYGEIPAGAWVFIVANDGGEKEKGYNDNDGNAKHVGIYADPSSPLPVRDSTRSTKTGRNGVGYRSLRDFTHVGLAYMIDFNPFVPPRLRPSKEEAGKALEILKRYVEEGE